MLLLTLVYSVNFLDRQVVATLAEPIRHDLHITDTQLGVLSGLAFALFYTTCGFPIAWLSDRFKRVWIMAACCGVWSLFTAASGLATNFLQLAITRMMVGAGEAGGSPPANSLISDYFPPHKRGMALALYSLGLPLGSMMGVVLAGHVAVSLGWRYAFLIAGLPGLILAPLILLVIREPERGRLDPPSPGSAGHAPAPPALEVIKAFLTNRTLICVAVAAGLSSFVSSGMQNWNVPLLIRAKGMTLDQVSTFYGLVVGITGIIGIFGSGLLADRLSRRDRRWYAWIPALAFVLNLPALAGLIWAPSWPLALMFIGVPAAVNTSYLAPALAVVQNTVPPAQRTMAAAVLLFIVSMIGVGGGPIVLGMISDWAMHDYGEHSLLVSYIALGPIVLVVIGAHLLSAKMIGRDIRDGEADRTGAFSPNPTMG